MPDLYVTGLHPAIESVARSRVGLTILSTTFDIVRVSEFHLDNYKTKNALVAIGSRSQVVWYKKKDHFSHRFKV